MAAASETTPLMGGATAGTAAAPAAATTQREQLYHFLEAKTPAGKRYELFMILLIIANVLAFILGSLFVQEYNSADWAKREGGICGNLCDTVWFGNYRDNGLQFLNIGSTSVMELVTVTVFTVEYALRLWICDLESPKYQGFTGRMRYVPTFFSLVDLASTVPFYIDAFVLRETDIAASAFLRMFRLLRMMRVEGRYDTGKKPSWLLPSLGSFCFFVCFYLYIIMHKKCSKNILFRPFAISYSSDHD